ncbi:MAG TPA: substrate-binding domain-containing protein [Ramlibacter sp.]|uniref:substrate-binding domain-containing protein n=1 Tax=Ramlibacter sp. TaxID=1917967 RepID=UPI002ED4BDFA
MRSISGLVLAASVLVGTAHAQALEIGGSTVVVKDTLQPAAAGIKETTGIDIKPLGMGSGRGMVSLFEGKIAIAAVSESLEEATASARTTLDEIGSKARVPGNLVYHEIGRDRISVFLHKDNPVGSLTRAQMKDIFTGRVRNWKDVGGTDLPIKVFLSSPGSGTRATFQKLAMDGADYTADATDFRSSLASVVEVGKEKGGVAVAGPSLLDDARSPHLKIANTPPVERPIALVTVGRPSEPAQKVIDYFRKKK